MAWSTEKTKSGQDLIWSGPEYGIAPSPNKGTANIQNANIATQSGEIMASYGRIAQTPSALTSQTLTPDGATNFTGPAGLKAGQWISVAASTVTDISTTTTPTTVSMEYLNVGGGGGSGGANTYASGGGGGGEVSTATTNFSAASYAITVGAGGAGGAPSSNGSTGGSSIIAGIDTALGGGGGGDGNTTINGSSGASGGGGGASNTTAGSGGAATAGFAGGNGNTDTSEVGGGGGGAGEVGFAATSGSAGAGGIGVSSSITGTATFYGGGGGGGSVSAGSPGAGGQGGGGAGGDGTSGTAGTANTGGGAGGRGGTGSGSAGGSGIVVISYTTGSCIAVGGDVTFNGTKTVHTFTSSGVFTVIAIPQTNLYYVSYKSGTTYKLSAKFDPTGANALTHGTTGSVTFSTVAVPNSMVAKSTEEYTTASAIQYRYYMLDTNSYVWVYDSLINATYGTEWMLPDPNSYSSLALTGLANINGMLLATGKAAVWGKPTVNLGNLFTFVRGSYMNDNFPTHRKFALVGKIGTMNYCDGNYIGQITPTTSFVTSEANVQSTCSYTASTTTGTVSAIVSGSLPYLTSGTRVPAVFFTDVYGTQPTNLTPNTVYYIGIDPISNQFSVYSSLTGIVAIDIASGAAGNQYFTTFWPFGGISGANGTAPLVQVTTQRLNLPAYETTQCMVEVGNTIVVGCNGSTLYPWNQIDATPSDAIELPESDVKSMVNVNNTAYVFAGNKGNVYITNNSVASLTLKVPDYCAGVPGTPLTYIEPTFVWGDSMYVRGRVYFSILDQTATKAGNCGGVWSFVPTQNIDPNQEIGMALRLENQNSYGDYDGYATILIPNEKQDATSPRYWSAWQDSYSTGTSSFGIDYTNTVPVTQYVVETDLMPTGTLFEKATFSQLEYKLTTPMQTNDAVQLYWRVNSTAAWTSAGTVEEETGDRMSGVFKGNFQKSQYMQIRAVVTTGGTTASSFVRMSQIRVR